MSAEYIMANGNENVILCERGIRTYESTYTRNTLDLSVVPVLKGADPPAGGGGPQPRHRPRLPGGAHGHGRRRCRGRRHHDRGPQRSPHALCDGAQSLTPEQFAQTARKIFRIREAMQE